MTLEIHPYCEKWPEFDQNALDALANDFKDNGQHNPIRIYKNQIIDGKNRYRACRMAQVVPKFLEWIPKSTTPDEIDAELRRFLLSQNNHRRHLGSNERAMIAAEMADNHQGRPEKNRPSGRFISQAEAAQRLGTSERSVRRAAKVLDDGTKELQEAVRSGEVSINKGAEIAELPQERQHEAIVEADIVKFPKIANDDTVLDGLGNPVPEKFKPEFRLRAEFKAALTALKKVHEITKALTDKPGGERLHYNALKKDIENVRRGIRFAMPHALCPYCKASGCEACNQLGWVAESTFKNAPSEMKQAIEADVGEFTMRPYAIAPKFDQPAKVNPVVDAKIDSLIGKLVRQFDERARANNCSNSPHHNACVDALRTVSNCWKEWKAAPSPRDSCRHEQTCCAF